MGVHNRSRRTSVLVLELNPPWKHGGVPITHCNLKFHFGNCLKAGREVFRSSNERGRQHRSRADEATAVKL